MDDATLEASYKRLQKYVHPDLYGSRSEREQQYSAQASADVNVAYQCLRNPVSRAQYLLQLHGCDAIGESVGSAKSDPQLLMRVMEVRELLEEDDTTPDDVRKQHAEITRDVAQAISGLAAAFEAAEYERASRLTVELQYLTKVLQETREWLASRDATHGDL